MYTPLHWAATSGADQAMEYLISLGANLDAQTDKG